MQKLHMAGLIKVYSFDRSTESLISAVAETHGLLEMCKDVLKGVYSNRNGIRDWLRQECNSRKVELQLFLHELATVVELFQSEKEDTRYAKLGVPPGTGAKALKKAYHRLSKKYHPDTADGVTDVDSQKFIEITKAYQELLGEIQSEPQGQTSRSGSYSPPPNDGWRQTMRQQVRWPRKIYAWALAAAFAVSLAFLIASTIHRKRMMIEGLHQSRDSAVAAIQEVPPRDGSEKRVEELVYEPAAAEILVETESENSKENELVVEKISVEDSIESDRSTEEPAGPTIEDSSLDERIRAFHIRPERRKRVVQAGLAVEQGPPDSGLPKQSGSRHLNTSQPAVKSTAALTYGGTGNGLEDIHWSYKDYVGPDLLLKEGAADPRRTARSDPDDTEKLSLNRRLDSFLEEYISAYEQRDIGIYSSLYVEDALENGQRFSEMYDTYANLFTVTSDLSLKLEKTSAIETERGMVFNGRFKVYWHYRDSGVMFGSGSISMELVDVAGKLMVKTVDYHFDQ